MKIIKELQNDYSDKLSSTVKRYFLVREKNKEYFMKKYMPNYGKVDIALEFNKAQKSYQVLKKNKFVRSIKPIRFDQDKRIILYNYIKYENTVRDEYFKLNSKIYKKDFFHIGVALAKIHEALNTKNRIKKTQNLFGDFTTNNILIKGKLLYIIDFEIPKNKNVNIVGDCMDDLVRFVFALESVPLKRFYLKFSNRSNIMIFYFLKGYESVQSEKFNYKAYLERKLKFLNIMRKVKKNYFGKRVHFIRKYLILKEYNKVKAQLYQYTNYRESYILNQKVNKYDNHYDNNHFFHTFIWNKIESRLLISILKKEKTNNFYLDFACGSGRVLQETENIFSKSYGIDVSNTMLNIARKKIKKSKLLQLDITKSFLPDNEIKFDIITAYRFFLNANNSLRYESLFHLHSLLKPNGKLIFNLHGNKWSFHLIYWFWAKIHNKEMRVLSYSGINKMIKQFDFTIVKVYGYGFLPRIFYLIFGQRLYLLIDIILQKIPFSQYFGSHQTYVCKKIKR